MTARQHCCGATEALLPPNRSVVSAARVAGHSTKVGHTKVGYHPRIFAYNRVGKAGSSSMHQWLLQVCSVHPFDFVKGSVSELDTKVAQLRASPSPMHTCAILYGHGRYIQPPSGVLYFNVIRQPIQRWLSLHDFYMSNGFFGLKTLPARIGGNGKEKDAVECIRTYGVSSCSGAVHDGNQTSVLLNGAREGCVVSEVFQRYTMILTIEEIESDLPRLLHLLVNDTESERALAAGRLRQEASRPPVLPKYAKTGPLPSDVEAKLRSALQCDFTIYDAVAAHNAALRDDSLVAGSAMNLTLRVVAPLGGKG